MAAHHKRLAAAVDEFIDLTERKRAVATARGYRLVLGALLQHVGDIELRNLNSGHIEDFFYGPAGLTAQHLTQSGKTRPAITENTHNLYRHRAVAFFRYCTRKGWMMKDIMVDVEPLKVERDKPRLRLSGQQLVDMLDLAQNPRDRAYIAAAQNTLKRASELVSLTVGDVDLAAGHLRIYNKKSKRWDRYPITEDLDHELRLWMTRYGVDIGRPLKSADILFPARSSSVWVDGGGRSEPNWMPGNRLNRAEEIIQRVLVKMGLETSQTGTHTIRRSVARAQFDRLANNGGYSSAMRIVGAMLDHKNQATTEIYLGLDEDRLRRDDLMHGQPFISALVPSKENVIAFKPVAGQG